MEINDKEIDKLSNLARIKLSDDEKIGLSKDIDDILGYVSEIQRVSSNLAKDGSIKKDALVNVLRDDKNPHEGGLYTEKILNEAPNTEGGYIKVKKIL